MEKPPKMTPAEIAVIVQERDVEPKELIKITFFDLLIKKVLKLERSADEEEDLFVLQGEKWGGYQAKIHEQVLLNVFKKIDGQPVAIHDFFKSAMSKIRAKGYFHVQFICKNQQVKQYLRKNFWDGLFGRVRLNEEGQAYSERLNRQLIELDAKFMRAYKTRSERVYGLMAKLGGYLLLLPSFEPGMLQKLDPKLMEAFLKRRRKQEVGGGDEREDVDLIYWETDAYMDSIGIFMLMDFGGFDRFDSAGFDFIDSAIDSGIDAGDSGGDGGGDGGGCSGCGGD